MEYVIKKNLQYFDAWSGGKDTLDTLRRLCIIKKDWKYIDTLDELIEETFTSTKTETDINDFLWFKKDEIATILGYENWENLFSEVYENKGLE